MSLPADASALSEAFCLMIKTILLRLLWLSIPILGLFALYYTGLIVFVSHMELRHDMIAIHNTIDKSRETFSNVQFHHRQPKEFMSNMIEQHDFLAASICVMCAILIFLIAYLTVTLLLCRASRRTIDRKASAQTEQNMAIQGPA